MTLILLDRPTEKPAPSRLWRPGDDAPSMLKRPGDPGYSPVVVSPKPGSLFKQPGEIDVFGEDWDFKRRRWFEETGLLGPIGGAAAGAWTFTNELRTKILQGSFAIGTDTFKMALLLGTSNIGSGSTTYAGVTNEVANANGYTTGGVTVTLSLSGTTSVPIAFTQAQWTASGGSITARFVLLYKSGANVYAYALCDSGAADVTATSGNTFTVTAGNVATLA